MLIKIPDTDLLFANAKKSDNFVKFPLFLFRGFRFKPYSGIGCEIIAAICNMQNVSLLFIFRCYEEGRNKVESKHDTKALN